MQATRQEILDYIRRHSEATVRSLASVLNLTSTGIRQHLAVLERDGLVNVRETRGRVGRPALVYSLTPAGDALFPNRYDDLSNLLLDEIRALAGSKGLQTVLMRLAHRSAEPYRGRMQTRKLPERVAETVEVINERGCLADSSTQTSDADEFLINQYTCPFPNVARLHRGVCAMEVEFIKQLTGGDVRLTNSLLRGDPCCTYRVRSTDNSPHQAMTTSRPTV
jgi:predicted ArsR family transcriptional regulator